jgi:uncharacterized protein
MPRPQCCRRIAGRPVASLFLPAGMAACDPAGIVLTLDEFEAIRLADLEGLYQEQAADRMNVSRPTFGRILAAAHRKVANALVRGGSLRIEGGTVREPSARPGPCGCPRCRRLAAEGPGTAPAVPTGEVPGCVGMRKRRTACRNDG